MGPIREKKVFGNQVCGSVARVKNVEITTATRSYVYLGNYVIYLGH